MSATLSYNGVRITVPVGELAEALRQIGQLSTLQPTGRRADAVERTGGSLDFFTAPDEEKKSNEALTIEFLQVLADHDGPSGVQTSAVMDALGASHPKGVGSKLIRINKALDSAGFATVDVYTNPRDSTGVRFWAGGPRLHDAIASMRAIESSLEGFTDVESNDDDNS